MSEFKQHKKLAQQRRMHFFGSVFALIFGGIVTAGLCSAFFPSGPGGYWSGAAGRGRCSSCHGAGQGTRTV